MAILGSDDQGGRAVGPCLIWVRLCLEQGAKAGLVAKAARSHERSAAVGTGELHLGAVREERAQNTHVSLLGCEVERRAALGAPRVDL